MLSFKLRDRWAGRLLAQICSTYYHSEAQAERAGAAQHWYMGLLSRNVHSLLPFSMGRSSAPPNWVSPCDFLWLRGW